MQTNRVFVNNYEAVCSASNSATELFENVCLKKSGIKIENDVWIGARSIILDGVKFYVLINLPEEI